MAVIARITGWLALIWLLPLAAQAQTPYSFGVLNQRSPALTASYWNPILAHVGGQAGVALSLAMGKDVQETDEATRRGDYDFVYTNHVIFTQENNRPAYRVILRPNEDAIRGEIVVPDDSPIRKLADLKGRDVGFPSRSAFVGYLVTMDHLQRSGVAVNAVFGANQEGVMAQLKAGAVAAASVNSRLMRDYAERTGLRYRVLWASPEYLNLPIAAHPRVPPEVVQRVRDAFDRMDATPAGQAVLASSAEVIRQAPPWGFRSASNREYDNYRQFYRSTQLKEAGQ